MPTTLYDLRSTYCTVEYNNIKIDLGSNQSYYVLLPEVATLGMSPSIASGPFSLPAGGC